MTRRSISSQSVPDCYLHNKSGWGHRRKVIWLNGKNDKTRWVCFSKSPFQALSWEVPPKKERESDKVRTDAEEIDYPYVILETPCTAVTPEDEKKSQPKIIIKGSR